ncbi:prepilin-type N-terminal cleavage/methylation domain-containing protein [[Eubacterium] hominis]|uniref:prepilin-type N-terminal cleavage/methylation domain-containing protein n=1 Tax=[Eubacterium] hominis TaxID=2764325 RepID=UPI0022E67741
MKKYKGSMNNGFTMVEVLVALSCLSLCLLLFSGVCGLLQKASDDTHQNDDIIAIRQLRMLSAQGYDMQCGNQECTFRYHDSDITLKLHNHRLVKTPGYEIFVKDIKEGYFAQEGNCITFHWNKQETTLYCE